MSVTQLGAYSLNDALAAAELSNAAYLQGAALQNRLGDLGWSLLDSMSARGHRSIPVTEADNAFAFSATQTLTDGTVQYAIAFRGSNSPFDEPNDWTWNHAGEWGFSEYYRSVRTVFAEMLDQAASDQDAGKTVEILITGHSLGGAAALAAFADLELPATTPLWNTTLYPDAPLGVGDRVLSDPVFDILGHTAEQIRSLASKTTTYTFGAPSVLMDPNKLTYYELEGAKFLANQFREALTFSYAGYSVNGFSPADVKFLKENYPNLIFTYETAQELYDNYSTHGIALGTAKFILDHYLDENAIAKAIKIAGGLAATAWLAAKVADAVTINTNDYNFDGGTYYNRVFQFEHEDSGWLRGGDPVSHLGTVDPGSVIDMDLLESIHDRYEDLTSAPSMHSIDAYIESLSRVLVNVDLLKDPAAVGSPVLPLVTVPTPNNDRIIVTSTGSGGAGNDILIAQQSAVLLDGGPGSDAFVISEWGTHVVLQGQAEARDIAYFTLVGGMYAIRPAEDSDELIIEISDGGDQQSNFTIPNWYAQTNSYQLADVINIRPDTINTWVPQHAILFWFLPLPNTRTLGDDLIWGSKSDDVMFGSMGNDEIFGRDGNDNIEGDFDNDELHGGNGADSLFGGMGDDVLQGDAGNDTLMGEEGRDGLYGGDGNDFLDGGSESDALSGGSGIDTLLGGAGNDQLFGSAEADLLDGGIGDDTYILIAGQGATVLHDTGGGLDTLVVRLDGADFAKTWFVADGANLRIELRTTEMVVLESFSIQAMDTQINQIEFLKIDNNSERIATYSLVTAWNAARTGNSDGSTAITAITDRDGSIPIPSEFNDLLKGTERDDYINGLGGNDTIESYEGDDLVFGGTGNDTIDAGSGNDTVMAGSGDDTITGGTGKDTLYGGAGDDVISIFDRGVVDGGIGYDTVTISSIYQPYSHGTRWTSNAVAADWSTSYAGVSALLSAGTSFELQAHNGSGWTVSLTLKDVESWSFLAGSAAADLLIVRGTENTYDGGGNTDALYADWSSATNAITWVNAPSTTQVVNGNTLSGIERMLVTTGSGNDQIDNSYTGNNTNDYIDTGAGNDTINGGAGNNTLIGGSGDDTYVVASTTNTLTELANEGADTVFASITWTLGTHLENLILAGTENLNGNGNELDNQITGNDFNNSLDGGMGADTLIGGLGNDTYWVDNPGDRVIETSALVGEIDSVQATLSWTLAANLENLTLLGSKAFTANGNGLDNQLTGNAAANILDGGTGVDTLIGSTGNDTYVADNVGDVIQETSTNPAEIDSVRSFVDWTLGDNLENLTLLGTKNLNGNGNSLNNTLTGNGGNNTFSGGAGNDFLDGASGNDTLTGDAGTDTLAFTTPLNTARNVDTLTDFVSGTDKIQLSPAIFHELGFSGAPSSDAFFHAGSAAQDTNDRILYDQSNGALFYDADGTGALAAMQFALLSSASTLIYSDFVVA